MKIEIKFLSKLIVLFFVVVACSGEDGMDGAQGPAGVDGMDGINGNANVFASEWLELPESFTNVRSSRVEVSFEVPEITQDIMDSGIILIYGRLSSGTIASIPFQVSEESYYYVINPGEVILGAESIPASLRFYNLFTDWRYIIIPSGNSTSGTMDETDSVIKVMASFDINNYYELIDYLDLEY